MSDAGFRPMSGYREQIVDSLTPVRPLPPPSRRVWLLVPLGLLLAASAPLLGGQRGDLGDYHPLVTWGLTALQSFAGLWLLALGFREAVPGRNVSSRALTFAAALSALLVVAITSVTNAASPTIVPVGRELQYWIECVAGPMAIGAPFMIVATLMALRAFPTQARDSRRPVRSLGRHPRGRRLAARVLDFSAVAHHRLARPRDTRARGCRLAAGCRRRSSPLEEAASIPRFALTRLPRPEGTPRNSFVSVNGPSMISILRCMPRVWSWHGRRTMEAA